MFRPQGRSFRAPVVAAGPARPICVVQPQQSSFDVHRTRVQLSIGTVPCESALDQSSTTNRGTRSNSFVFDVTRIKLRDSACLAITVSLGPIGCPSWANKGPDLTGSARRGPVQTHEWKASQFHSSQVVFLPLALERAAKQFVYDDHRQANAGHLACSHELVQTRRATLHRAMTAFVSGGCCISQTENPAPRVPDDRVVGGRPGNLQ